MIACRFASLLPGISLLLMASVPFRGPAAGDSTVLVFSPDGKSVAADAGDALVVWEAATGKSVRIPKEKPLSIYRGVAFSPDGKTLLSYGPRGSIQAFPVTGTGKPRIAVPAPASDASESYTCFALSPDGKTLAVGGFSGAVTLWDPAQGRTRATLSGHKQQIVRISYSPDGKRLYSTAYQEEGLLVRDLTALEKAPARMAPAFSVAFSPDGKRMAVFGGDAGSAVTLPIRDAATQADICTIVSNQVVRAAAFSPDGKSLVVDSGKSNEGSLRLYALPSGEETRVLLDRKGNLSGVTFSPDGTRVAALGTTPAGGPGLHVWDPSTGAEVLTVPFK